MPVLVMVSYSGKKLANQPAAIASFRVHTFEPPKVRPRKVQQRQIHNSATNTAPCHFHPPLTAVRYFTKNRLKYFLSSQQCRNVVTLYKRIYFPVALRPNADHVLLIHEVSRSHTTKHHSREDSSGREIGSSQRPLLDNTQHSQQTDIHAPGGIRTHNLSR